jgi:hypothetical protein
VAVLGSAVRRSRRLLKSAPEMVQYHARINGIC